jgi:hypothetical protein
MLLYCFIHLSYKPTIWSVIYNSFELSVTTFYRHLFPTIEWLKLGDEYLYVPGYPQPLVLTITTPHDTEFLGRCSQFYFGIWKGEIGLWSPFDCIGPLCSAPENAIVRLEIIKFLWLGETNNYFDVLNLSLYGYISLDLLWFCMCIALGIHASTLLESEK